jgi:hypothetical protein
MDGGELSCRAAEGTPLDPPHGAKLNENSSCVEHGARELSAQVRTRAAGGGTHGPRQNLS